MMITITIFIWKRIWNGEPLLIYLNRNMENMVIVYMKVIIEEFIKIIIINIQIVFIIIKQVILDIVKQLQVQHLIQFYTMI